MAGIQGPRAKDWVPRFRGDERTDALTNENDYRCGGGSSRQAWVSPWASLPHGDQKLPHLSQPASMAPSTINKAMRAAALPAVWRMAFDVASMKPRRPRRAPAHLRAKTSYGGFPNGFLADVRPCSPAAPPPRAGGIAVS